jgi:predicted nicotinamide N-methyase
VEALYPHCLVDHGDAPVWMISWPAAFALAEFLLLEADVAEKDVLELGCGTAVPGVAAALAGARVRSTDYDDYALAVARRNALENGVALDLGRLDWYSPDLDRRFPWVIGSEITYHEVAFAPLRRVLETALAPGGRVLLADIFRAQSTTFLARCQAAGWTVREHRRVVHLPAESRPIRIAELWRTLARGGGSRP